MDHPLPISPFANGGLKAGAFVIANPKAASGAARRGPLPPAWAVALTDGPGHAEALARQAAERGCPLVIAGGGDGTVNEVLNGLIAVDAARRPVLGILPTGTANDFARALGVPLRWDRAVELLSQGNARAFDVGVAEGGFGKRHFVVAAFIGGAAVMAQAANRHGKRTRGLWGYLPYLPAALRFSEQVTVQTEAGAWTRRVLSVQVANVRSGAGIPVCPAARPDDGLLDVMTVEAVPPLRTLALLACLPFGRHAALPFVHHATARAVTLEGGDALLCLDGDIAGPLPARITLVPNAVHVIVPENR